MLNEDYGVVIAKDLPRVIKEDSGMTSRKLSLAMNRGARYFECLIQKDTTPTMNAVLDMCDATGCELVLRKRDGRTYQIVRE